MFPSTVSTLSLSARVCPFQIAFAISAFLSFQPDSSSRTLPKSSGRSFGRGLCRWSDLSLPRFYGKWKVHLRVPTERHRNDRPYDCMNIPKLCHRLDHRPRLFRIRTLQLLRLFLRL